MLPQDDQNEVQHYLFGHAMSLVPLMMQWHHRITALVPVVSYDKRNHVTADFDCHLMLVPMASHDQTSHVAPHDCFDLANAIVPFMMFLSLYNANAGTITFVRLR